MADLLRERLQYGDFLMKEPNGFEYQSLGKAKDKWEGSEQFGKGNGTKMGPENHRAGGQEVRLDSRNKWLWVPQEGDLT